MRTPTMALKDRGFGGSELFDRLNMISSLMYEGTRGTGRLLLTNPESGSVDLTLAFAEAVPFREPRWARKALEMAAGRTSLVADCEKIFGLGQLASGVDPWTTQDVFQIEFLDHYHWRLSCGEEIMLISRYGTPSLPQEPFPKERLADTYQRLFPDARPSDLARFMELVIVYDGPARRVRDAVRLVQLNDACALAPIPCRSTVPCKMQPRSAGRKTQLRDR